MGINEGNWNSPALWDSTIFLLSGTMPCKTITSLMISSVVKGYGAGESVIPGFYAGTS